jgi:hypothetical protein
MLSGVPVQTTDRNQAHVPCLHQILVHRLFTLPSVPLHCLVAAYSLLTHCLLAIAYSVPLHCVITAFPLRLHCLCTACSLPVYSLLTASSLPFCTASSLSLHYLRECTAYSLPVTAFPLPLIAASQPNRMRPASSSRNERNRRERIYLE